jgi:SNF2 family DNA or RNA helicase
VAKQIYNVGDRILHEQFGEGLVVDVRRRDFYDILEVAFAEGVRKVTSIHPQISPKPAGGGARTHGDRQGERAPAAVAEAAPAEEGGAEAPAGGGAATEAARPDAPANPLLCAWSEPDVMMFEEETLKLLGLLGKRKRGDARGFALRLEAEQQSLSKGFERLISLDTVRDIERYPYQIRACLKVLRDMRGRALLADEVGLGKTIEAGLVLREYVTRGLVRSALVLCPVSLVTQWREELRHKFDLDFTVHSRTEEWKKARFVICSLDTAKTIRNRDQISEGSYDLVIVDEAHRLRNHNTLGWKFIHNLPTKYLLLLTATPVQNDMRELFNLITLLRPGTLGTYRSFRKQFMVRGDKRLPKNTRELSNLLSSVMIRTTRGKTSLVFPQRFVRTVRFELTAPERELYDSVSDFIYQTAHSADEAFFQKWHFILIVLQKEMGSSSFAALRTLEKTRSNYDLGPARAGIDRLHGLASAIRHNAKLDGLLGVLEEHREKVIVFTQFRSTLEYLKRELEARGHRTSIFHGNLNPDEKEAAIASFREEVPVLISTEAGGEGRNLQFCSTIVNYDLPWNPMKVEQRIGRVHRLGQTRDIHIYNFTTEDTVEAYVLDILLRKISMFELVIGEMDMILGNLDERTTFENRVFQIWASSRDRKELRKQFDEFGQRLVFARKRYETVKELDSAIFDTET